MTKDSHIISQDEQVVDVVRRHWASIAPITSALLALGLIDLFGFYLLGRYRTEVAEFGPPELVLLALFALLAFAGLLLYVTWWVFRQNRIIITDKNVYLVSQHSLFSNEVEQFGLERLQEVGAAQPGFFASILNYGHVTAETAGEEKNLEFRHARRPHEAANRIMERHKRLIADSKIAPDASSGKQ